MPGMVVSSLQWGCRSGLGVLDELVEQGGSVVPEDELLADLLADRVLVFDQIAQDIRRVRLELAAAQRVNEPLHSTDLAT
jgi:hypothetical protein